MEDGTDSFRLIDAQIYQLLTEVDQPQVTDELIEYLSTLNPTSETSQLSFFELEKIDPNIFCKDKEVSDKAKDSIAMLIDAYKKEEMQIWTTCGKLTEKL